MIQARNIGQRWVQLAVGGLQAAGNDLQVWIAEYDGFIENIFGRLLVAGTTGSQAVDLNKNLVTLLGATKIAFASTVVTATYPAATDVVRSFSKGDRISLDNDTVHTTPGRGLIVTLLVSRKDAGGPTFIDPASLNRI
jgi:hypothetical protein